MRIPWSLKMVGRSFIISIGLICLIFSVFPASGYIFDFEEGMGPGWIYEGDKRWYRTSEGHNSNYSMKSGDIDCSGTSSIYRYVEGDGKEPIEISFWWKKGGTAITNFTFSVDGRVERTCRSYEWDVESYTIPEDDEMHEIRWDFEKKTCHLQGAAWIDNVCIMPEFSIPEETDLIEKTEIYTSTEVSNVVYINPTNNLQEIIENSSNKILYLKCGVYRGPIYIGKNTTNVSIRSAQSTQWCVILDGLCNEYNSTIILDGTSNISIENVSIINSTHGIVIENSTDCNIYNNRIELFKCDGIRAKNISNCFIILNRIASVQAEYTNGINLDISNNNFLLDNDIKVPNYLMILFNSYDNLISYNNEGTISCTCGNDKPTDIEVQCNNASIINLCNYLCDNRNGEL